MNRYKIIVETFIFYIFQIFNNGALPQTPLTFLSWNKKVSKKNSRLCPLHSKNLRSKSWNRPNSFRRNTSELKQGRFLNAFLTCFLAHRTRSTRRAWLICIVLQIYKTNVSIFVMYWKKEYKNWSFDKLVIGFLLSVLHSSISVK